ncbi:MAG: manganese-dependent inorganic pyrophosphatase [Aerococcus sp.]|nr:manganese-dependent inorganic pyrophosphatase [Aerococcus sp.]
MSKILVFGHQNPDTDAITCAITYSHLLNELGETAEPVALGEINKETVYALNQFGFDAPRVIEKASDETDTVALVDHNEFQQSVSDIKDVTIHSVVDHHRISNFETAQPLYFNAKPLGSCQSVIYGLYQQYGVEVTPEIAGLMLSGLISDSLLFSSPTCTPYDKKIGQKLAEIVGVDSQTYGTEMLKAGASVDDKDAATIADGDAKSFEMGDYQMRIGQVNVVDIADVLDRKQEILDEMQSLSLANSYDGFLLIVTNILTNDSEGLFVGRDEIIPGLEEAFGVSVKDHQLPLKGVVSRKKQVVPPLTKTLAK